MQEGYLSPATTGHIYGVKGAALGLRSWAHHRAPELEDIQIVKDLEQDVITALGIAWPIAQM